jgi:hypothetical protein
MASTVRMTPCVVRREVKQPKANAMLAIYKSRRVMMVDHELELDGLLDREVFGRSPFRIWSI